MFNGPCAAARKDARMRVCENGAARIGREEGVQLFLLLWGAEVFTQVPHAVYCYPVRTVGGNDDWRPGEQIWRSERAKVRPTLPMQSPSTSFRMKCYQI